tara:strand:- start:577 stop:1026 length:450 start_codon:yes stop_codon:yes gene_type:complete
MNDSEEYINNKLLLLPMSYKLRRYERFREASINTEVVYLCMKNEAFIDLSNYTSQYDTFSNKISLYNLNFDTNDECIKYGRNMNEITIFNANVIIRHKKRMKFVKMIISKILCEKFPNMEIEHLKNDILPYLNWDTDSIFRGYNIEYIL